MILTRQQIPYFLGLATLITFFLWTDVHVFLTLLILILIGSISLLYKIFVNIPLGFELVTLVTVLAGSGISAKAGLLVGIVTPLLGLSLALKTFKNPSDTLLNMVFMGLIGYLAGFVPSHAIAGGGVFLTILFDALYLPTRYLISPNISKYLFYIMGHWLFNYTLFRALGPLGIRLVTP